MGTTPEQLEAYKLGWREGAAHMTLTPHRPGAELQTEYDHGYADGFDCFQVAVTMRIRRQAGLQCAVCTNTKKEGRPDASKD